MRFGFKSMKLGKEKLNELLYLFHDDNIRYGLIFKLIYIYARNAGEVLKLQKKDINYNDKTISFDLQGGVKTLPLHNDVVDDLELFTNELNNDEDFLFINVDESMELAIKKLNYYLYNTIDSLNKHIDFDCPKLTTKDFKILRGQHLLLAGVELHTIHDLYNNSNITATKNNINYNDLLWMIYPCRDITTLFNDYTDTNIYTDKCFDDNDIYTVNTDNETIIIEINYLENNVNIIAEQDSDNEELVSILNTALTDEAISKLQMMKPGQYKYLNDLRILKN